MAWVVHTVFWDGDAGVGSTPVFRLSILKKLLVDSVLLNSGSRRWSQVYVRFKYVE